MDLQLVRLPRARHRRHPRHRPGDRRGVRSTRAPPSSSAPATPGDRGDREGAGRTGAPACGASARRPRRRGAAAWVEAAAGAARRARRRRREHQRAGDPRHRGELVHRPSRSTSCTRCAWSQAALPHLEASSNGSIVAISSVSGREADFAAGPVRDHEDGDRRLHLRAGVPAGRRGPRQRRLARATPTSRAGSGSRSSRATPTLRVAVGLNPTGRMGTPEDSARAVVFLVQPGVQPHDRHAPRGRRRAHPGHPALSRAGGGRRVLTSRARATPRGAVARRRSSCPCRGRDRPTSRRAACRTAAPRRRRSGWRTGRRPAGCCPTPPGNRLSPVKTCVPASPGPRQTSAMLPGVCPRRWIDLEGLVADGHGVAVLDRAG